jgi:hypothetical protein
MATSKRTTTSATKAPAAKEAQPKPDNSERLISELQDKVAALSKQVEELRTSVNTHKHPVPQPAAVAPASGSSREVAVLKENLKACLRKMGARDHMLKGL